MLPHDCGSTAIDWTSYWITHICAAQPLPSSKAEPGQSGADAGPHLNVWFTREGE
jgi:hypothetical protein